MSQPNRRTQIASNGNLVPSTYFRIGSDCIAVSTLITLLWAATTLSATPPKTLDARTSNDSPLGESLTELLEPIRTKYELPALAAVVLRGDNVVASGAVGLRDIDSDEPVTIYDKFHIGSCTKSMTATLCAMLVERGKLSWDQTVTQSFPKLANKIQKGFRQVTLEQLLCHRAGISEKQIYEQLMKLRMLKGDMREQRLTVVDMFLSVPPEAPPGSKFIYSNAGYAIAGAMAEQATGKSWEQLIHELLFEPLGMNSAGFGPPSSPEKIDQPRGHRFMYGQVMSIDPGPFADNPQVIGPAGTVHSNLVDWAKYAALHLAGARGEAELLGPKSFQKLHSDPFDQDYGFGWGISEIDWAGGSLLRHDGSNTMWYARVQIAPKRNLAVLVATNRGDNVAEPFSAVIDALVSRFSAEK